MLKTIWHDKPYDFSIFRIVGGDLTPRDHLGSRLEMMKFILDNEKEFPRVHKGWILNAVPDMDYRRKMEDLLHDYKQYFVVLPMARKMYLSAKNRFEKIIHAIPINKSRNLAISHGKKIARFTLVLDGDCFFDDMTWKKIVSEIIIDQKLCNRKYYTIPHTRTFTRDVNFLKLPPTQLSEPMPVFRSDSTIKFDENIPFGKGDKQSLLKKLGCNHEHSKQHLMISDNICKMVGYVHHLATGDEDLEFNLKQRIEKRNESIDILLKKLDNFIPVPRKPNEYWKNIQGWFDFQGLYSHLILQAPENSDFVEVGSWLGASICYAATEAKNREKKIRFFAVDTWLGTHNDDLHHKLIDNVGGTNVLYQKFISHMELSGVDDLIFPLKMSSKEASLKFLDESLYCVFIDASHNYTDIKNDINFWYPKVKKGGIIAGHDYVPGHPDSDKGVVKAVNEIFNCKELEIGPAGRTWLHRKK